jgi:hypothetical protein
MGKLDKDREAKKKLNYVGEPKFDWSPEPTTYVRTAEQKAREQERSEYLDKVFREKLKQKRQKQYANE